MSSPQGPGASAPAVNLDTPPPEVRTRMAFQAPAPNDQERIREALSFVPSEDRDTWLKMGMAIKSEIGASGFDIWDDWSQGSDAYNAADARDVWKSIDASGKVRIGSLFREAKANGWRDIDRPTPPTPAELAERQRQADARAARDAEDIARQQAETAIKAAAGWDAAYPVTDDDRNPYLDRKGVSDANTENLRQIETDTAAKILGYHPTANGKRLTGLLLVVPLHRNGELVSLELIDASGTKAALKGKGTKTGAYWAAQPLDAIEGTVIVGEGVSTALSIQMATGLPVVAAPSVSNFPKVISAIQAGHKRLRPILLYLGDLDPSGVAIPKALQRNMADWHSVEVEVIRVALNPAQIAAYRLPLSPDAAKETDPNYGAWLAEYGDQTPVELDALHPRDLTQITKDALASVYDMTSVDAHKAKEAEERDLLRQMKRRVEDFIAGEWPEVFHAA